MVYMLGAGLSLTSMTLLESFSSYKQPIQMGREERLVLIFYTELRTEFMVPTFLETIVRFNKGR